MTSRPELARLATDALARDPVAVRPQSEAERDAMIAALTRAMQSNGRRRIQRRLGAVAGLAVAASVAGVFATRASLRVTPTSPAAADVTVQATRDSGGVRVWSRGVERALEDSARPLATGDRVAADAQGSATLRLSTGTQLRLGGDGDLEVASRSAEQRFALHGGSLHADVARVTPGQRFLVTTTDAEVEVHGTSFRVSIVPSVATCGGGTRTRVAVFEGIVAVRSGASEALLRAGDEWPRGCAPETVAATSPGGPPARAHRETPPRAAAAAPTPIQPGHLDPGATSGLAQENALYAEAVSARRRGDEAAALATYQAFIARYPTSALAENCAAERMRVLATRDRAAAIGAAKAYLARYPGGFAREEAESLAASPP